MKKIHSYEIYFYSCKIIIKVGIYDTYKSLWVKCKLHYSVSEENQQYTKKNDSCYPFW